jgi:hypothetical protein
MRLPAAAAAIAWSFAAASPAIGQSSHWGSPDDPTVKMIVAAERMWAETACAPRPAMKDVIADDFEGTGTDGTRHDKREEIATGPDTPYRDCLLGTVKVRFFGDALAIVYGEESRVRKDASGPGVKRCQVWTDTWLKRGNKWEIIAAQDTVVPCGP